MGCVTGNKRLDFDADTRVFKAMFTMLDRVNCTNVADNSTRCQRVFVNVFGEVGCLDH